MFSKLLEMLDTHQPLLVRGMMDIDFGRRSLWISVFFMLFNPLFWNIAGRLEYHTRILTKLARGNSRRACLYLAATIFSLGLLRDYLFQQAIKDQSSSKWFGPVLSDFLGPAMMLTGNVLVLASTYQLGIIGTYLGDHFGFLMKAPVTAFPYNICDHPMYEGATLIFMGYSLWYKSMAGMMLTGAAAIAYSIASKFEQYYHLFSGVGADTHVNRRRFTKKIYGQKSAKCQ